MIYSIGLIYILGAFILFLTALIILIIYFRNKFLNTSPKNSNNQNNLSDSNNKIKPLVTSENDNFSEAVHLDNLESNNTQSRQCEELIQNNNNVVASSNLEIPQKNDIATIEANDKSCINTTTEQIKDTASSNENQNVKSEYTSNNEGESEISIKNNNENEEIKKIEFFSENTDRQGDYIMNESEAKNENKINFEESNTLKLANYFFESSKSLINCSKYADIMENILDKLQEIISFDNAIALVNFEKIFKPVATRGSLSIEDIENLIKLKFTYKKFKDLFSDGNHLIINNCFSDESPVINIVLSKQTKSWMGIPLHKGNNIIGILILESDNCENFNDSTAIIVKAFLGQAALALENAKLLEEINLLTTKDTLTGLNNKRYFTDLAENAYRSCVRYKSPFCLLLIDIDYFKSLTEKHGSKTGDKILERISKILQTGARDVDIIGRYGNEIFSLALPQTKIENAVDIAERIRIKTENELIETENLDKISVTLSIGISYLKNDEPLNLEELLSHAEKALNKAKETGRNKVNVYDPKY